MRLYDDFGALVWESLCTTGTPNGIQDTPMGVCRISRKENPSELRGANIDGGRCESTVKYRMHFVENCIDSHDASWQTSGFGGTLYRRGFGSHGCVNLPADAALALCSIIQDGDVVVCRWKRSGQGKRLLRAPVHMVKECTGSRQRQLSLSKYFR